MENIILLMLVMAILAGIIIGANLDHLYIKYLVKKKHHIPKFLSNLGVELKKE